MTSNKISEVRMMQKEPEREHKIFTFKATQVVWLVFGILEAMILLRIALKALGANAANPIAAFIYGFTSLFLWPFAGLTGTPASGGMVLEISSLIAVVVYALIAYALAKIIWVIFYRPRGPVEGITQTTTTDQRTP
jgi:uncharacterized protein YggT (Ycf19 family)